MGAVEKDAYRESLCSLRPLGLPRSCIGTDVLDCSGLLSRTGGCLAGSDGRLLDFRGFFMARLQGNGPVIKGFDFGPS